MRERGACCFDGVGTVELSAANTFSGGVSFFSDTLDLANAHAAGSGAIDFISGGAGTLKIEEGTLPPMSSRALSPARRSTWLA